MKKTYDFNNTIQFVLILGSYNSSSSTSKITDPKIPDVSRIF